MMDRSELKEGSLYVAKISTGITTVRLDKIVDVPSHSFGGGQFSRGYRTRARVQYSCTNIKTGRQVTLKSAMKFRRLAEVTKPSAYMHSAEQQAIEEQSHRQEVNIERTAVDELIDELVTALGLTQPQSVIVQNIVTSHLQGMELDASACS